MTLKQAVCHSRIGADLIRLSLLLIGLGVFCAGSRAGDDDVYGPAAPPDSAFVRVLNATGQAGIEARIADKTLSEIGAYDASEFVFLPPGKHTLFIGAKNESVTLQKNRYYTAVYTGGAMKLLDNDRHTNRLKALLILYNLTDGSALSLRTADGKTVIDDVSANAYGTREVNAVRVSLAVFDGRGKLFDVKPLNLERGKALSLFVTGNREQPVLVTAVN